MSLRFAAAGLAVFAFATSADASAQQAAPACNAGSFVNENAIATYIFARPLNTWNRTDLASYGSGVISDVMAYGSRNVTPSMTRQVTTMLDGIERDRTVNRETNWESLQRRSHPVFIPLLGQLQNNTITIEQARVRAPEIVGEYVSRGLRILSELPARRGLCPTRSP